MVKFNIAKINIDDNFKKDDISNSKNNNSFSIEIKVKEKMNIGKHTFDENTLTRVSISN